ncbi:MAG: tetratricopeptide repeat protein [Verrucomicrobiota bacterium]
MIFRLLLFVTLVGSCWADPRLEPLPISPLWKSEEFQKVLTGSYGIDSRIEPVITVDEELYLKDAGELMAAGNRAGAIRLFEGASIMEGSPAMLFTYANLKFEAGDAEEAVEIFEKALAKFPNFRDAHRNYAIALIDLEKHDEAQEHLIRAVELGANDGLTLGMLGYCHALKENYQSSLQSYRLAQISMPDELQWKMGEAAALQQTKQVVAAIALYREILKAKPEDTFAWRNLGYALQQNEDDIAAVAAFEVLHSFGEMGPTDFLTLGHLYLGNELQEPALSCYTEAVQDENRPALSNAVSALRYLGDMEHWKEAAKFLDIILASYPGADDAELTRVRALVDFENGKQDQAIVIIRELVEKDPLDGQAIITLGRFLQTRKEYPEAEMVLQQAALLADHAADAYLQLGRIAVEKGEYGEAVDHIEKSFDRNPLPSVGTYLEAVRKLIRD